jgi:site-specific recombinase XerD
MSIYERNGKLYISIRYQRDGLTHHFNKRAVNPDNLQQKAKDKAKANFYDLKWQELAERGVDLEALYNGNGNAAVTRIYTVKELIDEVWPQEKASYRYPMRWPGPCLVRIKRDFGGKTFKDVTPLVGRAWLRTLTAEGLSPRTVNRHKEAAQVVWRWAVQSGLVSVNPWQQVPKLQELPTAKRILSRDDEKRLVEVCQGEEYASRRWHIEAAIIILVDHGLRPESEFFAMVRSQVNVQARVIEVVSYKGGGGRMVRRTVPMSERSVPYWSELLDRAKDERVFPYNRIKTSWKTVTKDAGLEGLWLRWLRDTCQNRWKEAGMHSEDIAALMGHSVLLNQVYNQVDLVAARQIMNQGVANVLQFDPAQKERQARRLA